MDTKNLLTLKTIVRTGSFQKAAEELGYTPSTITFQMRQLEQELSVQLFEKIGRRMVLTQVGQSLLPLVDEVLQTCTMIGGYGKTMERLEGDLVVAMPETLLVYRMQEVLRRFKEKAPKVNLYIQIGNCNKVRNEVISGAVHIGIHYDVCASNSSLEVDSIDEYRACLVAWPGIDKDECDFISENQTKKVSLIHYYANSIFQETIDAYLRQKRIHIAAAMELWNVEAIKKSVMNRIGIAYLPECAVEEELAQGELIQLATGMDEQTITAVCEWHKNKWLSPQMELFLKLIHETGKELW